MDEILKNIKNIKLSPADVSNIVEEILEMQKTCPHKDVQRWGPSYSIRSDGSYHKFDAYFCNDCGITSEHPL